MIAPFFIRPYQFHLQRVFDDAGYNLEGEPLISGLDQLCDKRKPTTATAVSNPLYPRASGGAGAGG